MVLEEYLNSKPLYYDKIDYNTIELAWKKLEPHIKLPYVIHIVGTNGKGSTGRYLASFLHQLGKNTLHYSSPHIIKFNERIWINGVDSGDEQLDSAHEKLQNILDEELKNHLTYFEYTTLIAILLSDSFDYIVLEAGLGGEFDATNVVKNNLSLFTTIGLDHTEFLGETIEEIAETKMRSCDENFIVGKQVCKIEVAQTKDKVLKDKNEISFVSDITLPSEASNLPIYLKNNMRLALSAMQFLNLEIKDFNVPKLFGRCEQIASNITIDVGHNSLAASVILREFIKKQSVIDGKKVNLIFNSYKDKDYNATLMILKPIIKKVSIIQITNDIRIASVEDIQKACSNLAIEYDTFYQIKDNEDYLVFGSFKVVEEFLKRYKG
jgi:dihydrofolate synthase/folylpolyglutamate synthase